MRLWYFIFLSRIFWSIPLVIIPRCIINYDDGWLTILFSKNWPRIIWHEYNLGPNRKLYPMKNRKLKLWTFSGIIMVARSQWLKLFACFSLHRVHLVHLQVRWQLHYAGAECKTVLRGSRAPKRLHQDTDQSDSLSNPPLSASHRVPPHMPIGSQSW